jgi:holo-[acyl-carrier protein] synthase
MGIGIDIVSIGRMERALARRPVMRERLFTETERQYCDARYMPAQHYAARFAAKEAIAKAFGRSLQWHDVEITHTHHGAPCAMLYGEARELAAGRELLISLSHSDGYAVACALLTS